MVLTRNPDVENGAILYETCAACHGVKGEGASDGSVPALAGQSYTVLAKQIVDFRAGLRSDPRMEHSIDRRHLSFSQPIADVAFYITKLPLPVPKQAPAGAAVAIGAMAYERLCAHCHGELGQGKEDTLAPRLASQHYAYTLKQLNAAVDGSRASLIQSHAALAKATTETEREAIAAWLSTISP
jgi:cytochrome c553